MSSWLETLGLEELAPLFEANHITYDVLQILTEDDLREIGISSLGHRKRIMAALSTVRLQEPSVPQDSGSAPAFEDESPPAPAGSLAPVEVPRDPRATVPNVVPAPAQAISHAEAVLHVEESVTVGQKPRRKLFSGAFLMISIAVHLLLGMVAVHWVVQKIEAKRKLQFSSVPPTAAPNKRAMEHKVSLQKKKNAGGSPAQAKRISVTGLASKITLPEMPAIPSTSTQFVAGRMAGMGGAGFGSGLGFGNGSGMGMGGAGAGGAGLTMFGARGGSGLMGTFYDLKQTRDGKPTEMAAQANVSDAQPMTAQYVDTVRSFISNWDTGVLERFYRSPNILVAPQLYIPMCPSDDAAKAFGEAKRCSGYRWLVHYKGTVIAPRDGTFRFIGRGDNLMMVRLNGKNVLDGGYPASYQLDPSVNTDNNLGPAGASGWTLSGGAWFEVRKGDLLKMEVVIGDGGGIFNDYLLIEERGVNYLSRRDARGALAYPVFQAASAQVPRPTRRPDGADPETANERVIFPGMGSPGALDILRR